MMDLFLTWTSSSTLTNPSLSTENLHTPASMSATIPLPLYPPKTVSSDPLQDEPISYAPHNTYKKNWTQSTQLPYNMNPTQDFTCSTQMTSPTINMLLPTIHRPLDTRYLATEPPYSQLQDTKRNWTSQNTQPLKRETLYLTVQTVPLNAVNSGTPLYPKLLAP